MVSAQQKQTKNMYISFSKQSIIVDKSFFNSCWNYRWWKWTFVSLINLPFLIRTTISNMYQKSYKNIFQMNAELIKIFKKIQIKFYLWTWEGLTWHFTLWQLTNSTIEMASSNTTAVLLQLSKMIEFTLPFTCIVDFEHLYMYTVCLLFVSEMTVSCLSTRNSC